MFDSQENSDIFKHLKIIDSHLHIGEIGKYFMPEKNLLCAIEKYHISKGLVSNIEAIEHDDQDRKTQTGSQIRTNEKTRKLVLENKNLKGLFWIQPAEGLTDEVKKYIIDNRTIFAGLKMHPYHSKLPVTDKQYTPYFDFAKKYNLPIAIHTALDIYSKSDYVYEVAKAFPDIDFIAVHMDLESDHKNAANYVKQQPNLYGDTTWITSGPQLKEIVTICGSHKILFGTDAPIDGINTYESYRSLLEYMALNFDKTDMENILYKNTEKIFFKRNG